MFRRKQVNGALFSSGPSAARSLFFWPAAFLADDVRPVSPATPHRTRTEQPPRVPALPP